MKDQRHSIKAAVATGTFTVSYRTALPRSLVFLFATRAYVSCAAWTRVAANSLSAARPTLVLLLICLTLPPATAAGAEAIDFGGLLAQILDRSQIAEFPEPAFVCKQASSYNRKSQQPGTPEWFSTDDYSNFIRCDEVGDRREWVMLNVEGPGAIVRWWITQYKYDGTVRVYLDGSDTPVLEGTGDELVAGKSASIVGAPLSAKRAAGCNLYLPIPFSKNCKITYDGANARETRKFGDNIYYNINYIQYPAGTNVRSFARDDLKSNAELIERVQRELLAPENNGLEAVRTIAGGKQVLTPGQSITRDIAAAGAICRLRVKVDFPVWHGSPALVESIDRRSPPSIETSGQAGGSAGRPATTKRSATAIDIEQAMRSTVIRAEFDGKQRVWAPVGGFFGSGPGLNPFKGWWRQVEQDGWMTCWWPMPFRETATISVTNHGTSDVTVELGDVAVAEWTWTDRTMYFHSSWRGDDHIAVFGNNYVLGEEWNYATIRGNGVYVGDTMAVFNRPLISKNSWWGEGDEKIYVDGESFPSHFGTGTEDYFGYAWGTAAPFEAPFHAQPRGDPNKGRGHTTNTRTRMLDRIPFHKSFKMNMELMHWRSGGTIDYATTTYWYAKDGAQGNGQTSPARVRRTIGQVDDEHAPK